MISKQEAQKLSYTEQERAIKDADEMVDEAIRKAIKVGLRAVVLRGEKSKLVTMRNLAMKAGYEAIVTHNGNQLDDPELKIVW